MKPLELTVYPLRDKVGRNARPGFIVGKRAVSVAEAHRMVTAKRLTDAELAAAYWMSSSRRERLLGYKDGYWSATDSAAEEEARRMNTIHRFATLPHYDEASL